MQEKQNVFAERLKEIRQQRGTRSIDMAKFLGISRAGYSNWEQGLRKPTYEDMADVAIKLGVSPSYLIGWTNEETASDYQPIDTTQVASSAGPVNIPNANADHAYSSGYLKRRNFDAQQLIAVTVDDDAMKSVVCQGDTVLVDMKRKRSDTRDLFAILVNGRVWVRWIRPELHNTYTLSSENPNDFPDQPLTREELANLDIIGRVSRIERDR